MPEKSVMSVPPPAGDDGIVVVLEYVLSVEYLLDFTDAFFIVLYFRYASCETPHETFHERGRKGKEERLNQ